MTGHTSIADLITEQLSSLFSKRDELLRDVAAIDAKIEGIANQLGVELPAAPADLPRLHHRPRVDKRYAGSLPEAIVDTLLSATRGYTRAELKAVLRDTPAGETIKKNENTYYNAVKRYIGADKIVEIDGLLYHPDRAPLPEGQDDPTGKHLPSNVASLFPPSRDGANNG